MAKHTRHCVTIVCGQCEKEFTYVTRANCQKMFCQDCSKKRTNQSKKESKDGIKTGTRKKRPNAGPTDKEAEAMLEQIPDKEIGWNSYLDIISKSAN